MTDANHHDANIRYLQLKIRYHHYARLAAMYEAEARECDPFEKNASLRQALADHSRRNAHHHQLMFDDYSKMLTDEGGQP